MSNIKQAFSVTGAITITLASLASAGARESLVVDNGSNLYLDAMITIKIKVAAALAADKALYIWLVGNENGTDYDDNATGADAGITLRSPNNFKGPFVINTPTDSLTYKAVIGSVASYFGGILPRKFSVIVENRTGQALDAGAGNHAVTYTGVYNVVS